MRLGLRPTVFQGTPAAESHSISANGSSDPSDNENDAATTPSKAEPSIDSPATWSKARKLYGNVDKMWERHRHRYEVNPEEVPRLEASGLTFVGKDEKGERMQILELKGTHGVIRRVHMTDRSLRNVVLGYINRSPVLPRPAAAP